MRNPQGRPRARTGKGPPLPCHSGAPSRLRPTAQSNVALHPMSSDLDQWVGHSLLPQRALSELDPSPSYVVVLALPEGSHCVPCDMSTSLPSPTPLFSCGGCVRVVPPSRDRLGRNQDVAKYVNFRDESLLLGWAGSECKGGPCVKSQKFPLGLLTIVPPHTPAPRPLPLGADLYP
mgnify:CR=1 FL=1